MKQICLTLTFLFAMVGTMLAQRTVMGTVTGDDGEPLIGASVRVKGASAGAVTDINGKYSVSVPSGATTLSISYTGFETTDVALGASNVMDVVLKTAAVLKEIVVTATGLTRNKSDVVYANQTVNSEQLNSTTNRSVLNALQGKTAGVKIQSSSGAVGASTRIVLRGETSLTQGNNALIVVDGVPINNTSASGGGGTGSAGGGAQGDRDNYVDFGNRANDINPDDVESVTVLKGPAATTLFGSRGGSGVILITTKKGKASDKPNVSVGSSYSVEQAYLQYKYQERFGSGYKSCGGCGGGIDIFMGENFAWGAEYDGRPIPWTAVPFDPVTHAPIPLNNGKIEQLVRPYSAVPDNLAHFFDLGNTYRNRFSIDGGTDKFNYYIGYTNFSNKGIVVGTELNKHNVIFNAGAKFSKHLNSQFSVNYTKLDQRGATEGGYPFGYGSGTPAMAFATQTPANIPFEELRDYNSPYHDFKGFYAQYSINPFFILNEQEVRNSVDNLIASATLTYNVNAHLAVTGRMSTNYTISGVTEKNPKFGYHQAFVWADGALSDGGREPVSTGSLGSYKESSDRFTHLIGDVFATYNRDLNSDFRLGATVGINSVQQERSRVTGTTVGGLVVPGFYNLSNSTQPALAENNRGSKYRLVGGYVNATLGYRNFLFLEYSARNDYSSTLPQGNRGFFYQGGGVSFVPTQMSSWTPGGLISNMKFRAGLGTAGKDAPLYRLASTYNVNPLLLNLGDNYQIRFPFAGQPGANINNIIGNPNLKPELSTTFEVGFDLGLWKDRIELEYTYYNISSENQIVDVNIPWSSGFSIVPLNIGKMTNKGHEVVLRLTPIKTRDFQWKVYGTWAKNTNEVVTIIDNGKPGDELNIYTGLVHFTGHGSLNLIAAEGKPFGTFKGTNWVRDSRGNLVVDANGNPKQSAELEYLGSYQPDWIGSLGTEFTYKGLTLRGLLDTRQGGLFFSGTKVSTEFNGTALTTIVNNREPFVVPGSVLSDGSANTKETQAYQYFKAFPAGAYLLDASYVKLREISLSYTLPHSWIPSVKSLTVGVFAKNLKFWLPAANTFADPEVGGVGAATDAQGVETTTTPPSRSYGVDVSLKF